MTAQAYNALTAASLGADKIIRATTMQSLYDNPTAIAQRGSGAPWNNGIGAIAVLTSGSGNWTVPDGVYRIKVTAVGGGGGGGAGGGNFNGGAGGNTTFSTLTANGGAGGTGSASGTGAPGAGGAASGGDFNISGGSGGIGAISDNSGRGGDSHLGYGGREQHSASSSGIAGSSYGGGGSGGLAPSAASSGGGGGGGGTAVKVFTTTPGDALAYAVGAAGSVSTGSYNGAAGAAGIIIIEY